MNYTHTLTLYITFKSSRRKAVLRICFYYLPVVLFAMLRTLEEIRWSLPTILSTVRQGPWCSPLLWPAGESSRWGDTLERADWTFPLFCWNTQSLVQSVDSLCQTACCLKKYKLKLMLMHTSSIKSLIKLYQTDKMYQDLFKVHNWKLVLTLWLSAGTGPLSFLSPLCSPVWFNLSSSLSSSSSRLLLLCSSLSSFSWASNIRASRLSSCARASSSASWSCLDLWLAKVSSSSFRTTSSLWASTWPRRSTTYRRVNKRVNRKKVVLLMKVEVSNCVSTSTYFCCYCVKSLKSLSVRS